MQCPTTNPSVNSKKFHFVPAGSNTSCVSMPSFSNISANSFTNAMLISRYEFSITFAASATFMEDALDVPTVMMLLYKARFLLLAIRLCLLQVYDLFLTVILEFFAH